MLGKVLDMNFTEAFINFQDGTTKDIELVQLPKGTKIGDTVNVEPTPIRLSNDKLVDFF